MSGRLLLNGDGDGSGGVGENNDSNNLFFKDKSFCLDFPTSLSSTKKNQYSQFIKDKGGKIDFSITSKTSYYITHIENIKSKSFRAKSAIKLNIGILLDTFIYDSFNSTTQSSSLDFLSYLFINGEPAVESINYDLIENSISESNFILNNILSTHVKLNTPSPKTTITATKTISSLVENNYHNDTNKVEEEEDDDNVSMISSNESSVFGSNFFKSTSSSYNDSTYRPYLFSTTPTTTTTLIDTNYSITTTTTSPNKPLSRFEQLLLQKKEIAEKKKLETIKLDEERKRKQNELLEQKKKEKQEKLEQLQKEKEIKIEAEKERRKQVLEKTKSTLTASELIKLTSTTTTSNNKNNNNNKNNKNNNNIKNNNNKKSSSTFSIKQIDHEGIRIRKEIEKKQRLEKQEKDLEIKKQEKLERTRIFHETKAERERIEREEKIKKDKENLEAFLKRQQKRLEKEKKELERLAALKENGGVDESTDATTQPVVVVAEPLVDEDLRKLFVGGINCDDLDDKTKKDLKKLNKIKDRRIHYLLKLFDKFGPVQKRVVIPEKGIFFITFKDVESCTKAVQHFSTSENRKLSIEEISKIPKKSPQYTPNKNFYVKIVKSHDKAAKKEHFEKKKVENLKNEAKKLKQDEEDAEFEDWTIA